MSQLKSGWFAINAYILNDGQFSPGENWILRGEPFDGRSSFGISTMCSMALRGSGFTYKHAGFKPTLLFINLLNDEASVLQRIYREVTNYCDLQVGLLTDPIEQRAYLDAKFLQLGWRIEIRTGLTPFGVDAYQAIKAELHANNQGIVAVMFDHLPYAGDSTESLNALFDEGSDVIQLMTVGKDVTSTDPRLTAYVDVTLHGQNILLLTEKQGISNTLAIPTLPALSQGWERDQGNPVLIETD